MSESNEPRPALEEDVIATGRIVAALVATIVLTVVCLVWVMLVMKPFERADRGSALPIATPERGGPPAVDRTLYEDRGPGYAIEQAARKRADLDSWGWIDREKRTVRLPITRAMRIVVVQAGDSQR
jgi:hypothetical protein